MTKGSKKQSRLSDKMQRLKENILALLLERKTLMEQVYEGSRFASLVTTGISNVFNVIASFLSSFKTIPIIGSVFQTIATIPQAISFIADPKITFTQKAITGLVLLVVGGIALAAFMLGNIATLILGTVFSSIFTLLEGYNFTTRVIDKFKKSNRYNESNEFVTLIQERRYPETDKYNEQLEVRAVELEHLLAGNQFKKETKRKLKNELGFIKGILNKKEIIIGQNPENTASQLSELYKIHQDQLGELAEKLSLITEATKLEGHDDILDEIQKIQNAILTTEEDIALITKPIKELNFENNIASDKLSISFSTFMLNVAATLVSFMGLLLGLGVIAAPHVFVPIMVGIGISLAIAGLIRWIAEKVTQYDERTYLRKKEEHQKETILDESLYMHEQNLGKDNSASKGNSSHSKHMYDLLNPQQTVTEEPKPAIINSPRPNEHVTLFDFGQNVTAEQLEKSHQADNDPIAYENMTLQ
ncbi:hypothetical protein ELY21_07385 [Legionella sp. km535]|uniref:T4SS effector SidA family protein n=1 Tax=Legionella sp. km535 TaxID=2498107 RepID=UPI000F8D4DCD|nr:T4SS effector SidA family protein [Legionella sp. km535]RUR18517.1 hypothetical protein ELY21_07385 [Legionella sp. km535]